MIQVFARRCKDYDIKKIKQIFFDIFSLSDFLNKLGTLNSVLLKPNILGPYPPEKGVTTHPVFISGLLEILKDYNIKISLLDNPGGARKYKQVLQKSGILDLTRKYDIKILEPTSSDIYQFGKNCEYIISKPFLDCQAIINLPKLKTHTLTLYTGAVKNFYGVIPGLAKANYHRFAPNPTKFAKTIVDIYSILKDKIIFNLMDGIIGMDGNGPSSGDTKNFGVILGSQDAVGLDFCAARMMGYNPKKIPSIMIAAKRSEISTDEIKLTGDFDMNYKLENVNIKRSKISNIIVRLLSSPFKGPIKKFFWSYPDFYSEKCNMCESCVKFCPVSALKISKKLSIPQLNRKKCILCLCCMEICSENAVHLKKSLLVKFFIR